MTSRNGPKKSTKADWLSEQSDQARAAMECAVEDIERRVHEEWTHLDQILTERPWLAWISVALVGIGLGWLLSPRRSPRAVTPPRSTDEPRPASVREPESEERPERLAQSAGGSAPTAQTLKGLIVPPLAQALARVLEQSLTQVVEHAMARANAASETRKSKKRPAQHDEDSGDDP